MLLDDDTMSLLGQIKWYNVHLFQRGRSNQEQECDIQGMTNNILQLQTLMAVISKAGMLFTRFRAEVHIYNVYFDHG